MWDVWDRHCGMCIAYSGIGLHALQAYAHGLVPGNCCSAGLVSKMKERALFPTSRQPSHLRAAGEASFSSSATGTSA